MLRTLPSTSPSPIAECAQLRGANHSSLGFSRQPAIARAVWGTCRGSKGRRAVGASRSERGGKRRRSCLGKMKRSFSKSRVRTIPSELVVHFCKRKNANLHNLQNPFKMPTLLSFDAVSFASSLNAFDSRTQRSRARYIHQYARGCAAQHKQHSRTGMAARV